MKITIITVVYNAEKVLRSTLEAVLNQSVAPYEYLIIDGNSDDDTLVIAKDMQKTFRSKGINYRIISEPDNGIYDAMNKGVDLATGDFIVFSNAGDYLDIDAVKLFQETYDKTKYDFAYGSIRYIGGKTLIKKSRLDTIMVSSRNWNHPSSIVRKELYKGNAFNLNYKIYADFEWYLKIRKRKDIKIVILPGNRVVSNFLVGGASMNDSLLLAIKRGREKYRAYVENGYSSLYFIESYVWEIAKYFFVKFNKIS